MAAVAVQLKMKLTVHMYPYNGGEKSGKKAKPDAQVMRVI
jgi:hypothetical protein